MWQATSLPQVSLVLDNCQKALAAGLSVAGFVSYEAAPALDSAFAVHRRTLQNLPLAFFAAFDRGSVPEQLEAEEYALSGWQIDSTEQDHARAIAEIRRRIAAGDTYQVNHTMRLRSRLHGSAAGLYRELRRRQPAPFSAFVDTGDHQLLSSSPELFFLKAGGRLLTRPMKGTTRRSADAAEDARLASELRASAKERAENVMITDLLRNDLGHVAVPGSVTVEKLLQIESQPTFHALTSTVSAEPAAGTGFAETMAALFPCGSVTGAPKASTMGLIRQLENEPRGIYCGTIGYAEPDGTWAFNVAIRTMQVEAATGQLVYGTGGGITWDSDAEAEYGEALLKASFLPGAPKEWKAGRPATAHE